MSVMRALKPAAVLLAMVQPLPTGATQVPTNNSHPHGLTTVTSRDGTPIAVERTGSGYDSAILAPYQSGRPLPAERRSSVPVATLLLVGDKSPTWIKNAIQACGEAVPHAELGVFAGQTHMVKPKATAPALLEFLGTDQPRRACAGGDGDGHSRRQADRAVVAR
jgi:hypothetical protein